ncbi:MAG: heat shock protein HspQ [Pseudolabrys sp.]
MSNAVVRNAKYTVGQIVKHRIYPFRGVIFDIDPVFNNTEEWWQAIPAEIRPRKDQPFYHLFAENSETEYVAYVSEQNLLPDTSDTPLRHPDVAEVFEQDDNGGYLPRRTGLH